MRIVMTGGGTGGHIYAATAIADRIREKNEDAEVLFIGTTRGLERELVPQQGYPIEYVNVSGLNRKALWKNVGVIRQAYIAKKKAGETLEAFAPDVVIGTGGYVSGPVIEAAHSLGIKCYIHEQNAHPGLTNRLLERCAEKVFISFNEARRYFRNKDKLVFTGNPVRKEFFESDRASSREALGIGDDEFVLLTFGGSQGAKRINDAMLDVVRFYHDMRNIRIYFVTGNRHYAEIEKDLEGRKLEDGNIKLIKYLVEMPKYLHAADLVIGRAGALTLSEIMVCNKPSILIPSPIATRNHQFHNAMAAANIGAATVIEERELNRSTLIREIERIRNNPELMHEMGEACARLIKRDAAEIIYEELDLNKKV